jgi:hypothetical protein
MLVATVIDFPVHDVYRYTQMTVIIKPSNTTSRPPAYTESELFVRWGEFIAQRSVLEVDDGSTIQY